VDLDSALAAALAVAASSLIYIGGKLRGWSRSARSLSAGAVLVLAGGLSLLVSREAGRIDLRYYEVVAQVLPVLVLAVAIERRAFALDQFQDRGRRLMATGLVLAMMAGEVAALAAVASRHPTSLLFAITALALVLSGVALLHAMLGLDAA
jgi:hypothetical protein